MKDYDKDVFLAGVVKTITDAVQEQNLEHPLDIMGTVLSVAETLYAFSNNTY